MLAKVSRHAELRWHQRSATPEIWPGTAWDSAEPVPGTTLDADEVRYHSPSSTLLLRKRRTLVTVIDVESLSAQNHRRLEAAIGGEPA